LVQQVRVAVPFAFSHLTPFAMAVVADGTSQVDAAAAASDARENSAVGDEPGLSSWAQLQEEIKNGTQSILCEPYFAMLVMSVEERLLSFLTQDPAVGGITLEGALHEQHPLTMETTGCMTTTKEHWRWDNCRMSFVKQSSLPFRRISVLVLQGTAALGRGNSRRLRSHVWTDVRWAGSLERRKVCALVG
jgi:hypothetical protein